MLFSDYLDIYKKIYKFKIRETSLKKIKRSIFNNLCV